MTIFESLILGVIEGLTEFLPISSSGHILLASNAMGIEQDSFMKSFNIIIQIAPVFAIAIIYFQRLIQSLDLWKKLFVAFLPVGFVGFLANDYIESVFSASLTSAWMIVTGIFFLIVEFFYSKKGHNTSELESVTYTQALYVGLFQVFALIPGISRSGSTILGGMLVGLKREVSISFSFLLAIPVTSAASGYTLLKTYKDLSFDHIEVLGLGFVTAFITGWITVKLFLAIVAKYNFTPFAIYLIVAGLLYSFLGVNV